MNTFKGIENQSGIETLRQLNTADLFDIFLKAFENMSLMEVVSFSIIVLFMFILIYVVFKNIFLKLFGIIWFFGGGDHIKKDLIEISLFAKSAKKLIFEKEEGGKK